MPATRPRTQPVRVAIIGAGLGGIATAVKLQKKTSATFVIFEKSAEVGGTWFVNRYPGCEVDIHSHAYSFSFDRNDWPRTHATQPELLAYANRIVDEHGLRDHLRLNTTVTDLSWEESERHYTLRTSDGEQHTFDVVVSAVGLLSVPKYPDWPGLSDFEGVCFHTSRWENHDLSGKRVAVVGTGSTAAQVVPGIADQVGSLLVFQRQPGWVEPKNERAFSPFERWLYRDVPGAQKLHRAWLFYKSAKRIRGYDASSKMQVRLRQNCLDFIAASIDDPALREAVTPDYPWGCKRPVLASTFYSALTLPHVELVPHAVTSVRPDGLVDDTGTFRPVDVLILSTGFQPTKFLTGIDVKGQEGRSLHDVWRSRASAFLGITVSGFPNFFILYGPNTNGGLSIIAQLERQAEVAVRAVRQLQRHRGDLVDTDNRAQRWFVDWVDRRIRTKASATESGCHNYYHTPEGDNVTQWPGSHLLYLAMTRTLGRWGIRARRQELGRSS